MAVTMAALLIVSILLGAWLLNVRQQNRALVARLNQQGSAAAENVALQTRVGELQREQSALSARMAQQQSSGQEESKVEIEKLKNQLAELTRPQLDVPQIDVDPNNETRGAGSGAKAPVTAINVPAAASSFTINLPGAGSKPFPHYLIELLEAKTNKVVWSARRRQDKETTFTLTLMKRSLPPGKYRIRVSGLNGKQPELLGNYDIQVSFQSQPGNPAGIR